MLSQGGLPWPLCQRGPLHVHTTHSISSGDINSGAGKRVEEDLPRSLGHKEQRMPCGKQSTSTQPQESPISTSTKALPSVTLISLAGGLYSRPCSEFSLGQTRVGGAPDGLGFPAGKTVSLRAIIPMLKATYRQATKRDP